MLWHDRLIPRMIGRHSIVAVLVVLTGVTAVVVARPELSAYASGAALFVLIAAVIQPILQLIEMDADGRLDHIRLAGQRPRDAFFRFAARAGGPWLVLAVGLFAISLERDHLAADLLMALGIVGVSCVWAILLLAVPQQGVRIDTRIFGTGLVLAALVAAFSYTAVMPGPRTGSRQPSSPPPALIALFVVVGVSGLATLLRSAIRSLERQRARASWLTKASWLEARSWPTLDQVLVLGGKRAITVIAWYSAAVVITVIATLLFEASSTKRGARGSFDFAVITGFALVPVAMWTLAASSRSRSNIESGRLDLVRLIPAITARSFLSHITGVWCEPLLVTVTAFVTLRMQWQQWPPGTMAAALILLAVVPVSVLEGWHRRWPLTYVVAALGLLVWLAISFPATYPLRMLAVIWIPWALAFRTFRRPDVSPIRPLLATTGAAAIAGALLWPV